MPIHTTLFEKKLFQGMEVANGPDYYPEAHKWCLEKNLTMLGNSDIHDPDLRQQTTPIDHRTMTLVFVKEKTVAGLKEALFAGRTAVWWKDELIGRSEWLDPLAKQSILIAPPHVWTDKSLRVRIRNVSDVDIHLERTGNIGPEKLDLPAGTTSLVEIAVAKGSRPLELKYTAKNSVMRNT